MRRFNLAAAAIAVLFTAPAAHATTVSFTKLTGLTGGTPAGTALYEADLTGDGLISSVSIQDNSFGLGGAPGQFSGFDLDAIVLSTTSISDASQAGTLTPLAVFDFTGAGTIFTPGAQRSPVDSKLFGTDVTGTKVDNSVATLGSFDANSTTAIPGAFGFISLGDGGILSFNLTSVVDTTGLHLYIGEVGDNGEVAAGAITVSRDPISTVPEPATLTLLGTGIIAAGRRRLRARRG